jgi:two-component system, LytTR family, response regulator
MEDTPLKAFVVDDERLARTELKRLLSVHPDVVVAGEARNVPEAERQLRSLAVDLLFLDIRMPDADGFKLLEKLDSVPAVIFTTAYDDYAVRAFEVNALDYLLKPVEPERLAAAPAKARQQQVVAATTTAPLAQVLQRVFVRDGERCWIVRLQDIRLLESEGNYTRLYFGGNQPLILKPLQALEQRIDPAIFFRAGRGHIFNLPFVENVETDVDGSYIVGLRGGPQVNVSRRQSRKLRESLSI